MVCEGTLGIYIEHVAPTGLAFDSAQLNICYERDAPMGLLDLPRALNSPIGATRS